MKLLVLQTAFIGDLIMTTPIFKAIKQEFPDSEIHALTIPSASIILKHNPYISKIIEFDKKNGFIRKIFSIFKIIKQIKHQKYDLAISVQSSITSSFILLFAGIKRRIGNKRMKFATDNVIIPKGLHNRERVLTMLSPISKGKFSSETEIFLSEIEINTANKIISDNNSFNMTRIGIAPGSARKTKMWISDYYSELIDRLAESNYHIYFFGSSNEFELINSIINKSSATNIFNYAGKLNLLESAALIKMMNLMITNDSSPLHIANAVKTDVFAIFGPTVKQFGCYPYRENDRIIEVELDCRPCNKHGSDKCPLLHHNCMKLIKPNEILELIKSKFD